MEYHRAAAARAGMAEPQPLVVEFLENVPVGVFNRRQARRKLLKYVRGRQGVYALYSKGRLYYVGLARDLHRRLADHLRDQHRKNWDQFSAYLATDDSRLKELEALILRIVQPRPKGNVQVGKFVAAEDLLPDLLAAVKAEHRKELGEFGDLPSQRSAQKRTPTTMLAKPSKNSPVPVLANYPAILGHALRGKYKGNSVQALVGQDGRVEFGGQFFNSPSTAAKAAIGRERDGWTSFWQFQDESGNWVPLDDLRRRPRALSSSA